MMPYFDEKQIKLIISWHKLSEKSEDYYMSFISEWIAFNAICYNLYYDKAVLERANIDRKKSKKFLNAKSDNEFNNVDISAKISVKEISDNDWTLQIDFPETERLFLSISKKYTEDIIYQLFAEEYENWYKENKKEIQPLYNELKESLKKDDFSQSENLRYYVINMQKKKSLYKEDIDRLASKNIIILCEQNDLKTVIKVLYQIRNNIFHGEKIPGETNDDRIVKSALPLLKYLIRELIKIHKINLI